MSAQVLATLAEVRDRRQIADETLPDQLVFLSPEAMLRWCATVERLAHGMQDVAAWLSDYDQMPEGGAKASMKGAHDLALALLTQLGATP